MSGYNFGATLQGLKGAIQENAGWAMGNQEMQDAGTASRTTDGDEFTTQAHGYAESMKTALGSGLMQAGSYLLGSSDAKEDKSDNP